MRKIGERKMRLSSGWLVGPAYDGIKKEYEVYRLIDATDGNIEENREVYDHYPARNEAVSVAKELNQKEAERFWKK